MRPVVRLLVGIKLALQELWRGLRHAFWGCHMQECQYERSWRGEELWRCVRCGRGWML